MFKNYIFTPISYDYTYGSGVVIAEREYEYSGRGNTRTGYMYGGLSGNGYGNGFKLNSANEYYYPDVERDTN